MKFQSEEAMKTREVETIPTEKGNGNGKERAHLTLL